MKKIQRILAVIGVLLLLAMYGSTMVFALSGSADSTGWFKASIYCTVIVPVLLYAYTLIYKYLKHRNDVPEYIQKEEAKKEAQKGAEKEAKRKKESELEGAEGTKKDVEEAHDKKHSI